MSRTIILGDPHLGKGLSIGKPGIGTGLNSRVIDQINLLDWVLDQAIELAATNIIITGDIFEDPKPHPTFITILLNWLKKCETENIGVHIISGNHDLLRSGSFTVSALDIISETELNNIFIYKDIKTVHMESVSFTLFPFRDRRSFNSNSNAEAISLLRSKLPYEFSSIPKFNKKVLIGHVAIEGSIPVGDEFDDISNELFCPLDMFSEYDYVWMGHVHKPQVFSKTPYISHIGSMDLSDFGETEHKKIIVLFDTENPNFFKEIQIPTRPLKKINITIPQDELDATNFILNYLSNENLIKCILRLDINIVNPLSKSCDRTIIENAVYKMGAHHIAKFSETKKISPIKKINELEEKIDNQMNETKAINLYAETIINKDIKNDFIKRAQDIIIESKADGKD